MAGLNDAIALSNALSARLAIDVEDPVDAAVKAPHLRSDALAIHRRAHRPGSPSRIDTDPKLRAFILARIDTCTFDALVTAIAAAFPPERRVRKSALHRWWQLNPKPETRPHHS